MPFRIGFIGAGWINSIYAQSLQKLPDLELAAVYNHRLPRAAEFSEKFCRGSAFPTDDLSTFLDTPLDIAFIALPPGAHEGQAEAAAQRGLHLMLEKPIALNLDRARSIALAVKKAGVLCQIGHHMRHTEPAKKLKAAIADGSAGKPLFLQARFFANGLFPAWWRSRTLGGGQLIEQSIHLYDLARHYFGEPDTVSAFAGNLAHGRFSDYDVDDASAASIRFRSGALASICATNFAETQTGGASFTVLCENLTAEFHSPSSATFSTFKGKPEERPGAQPHRETFTDPASPYDRLTSDFIASVRGHAPLVSTVDDGVNSLALVLAASRSAQSGGAPQTP